MFVCLCGKFLCVVHLCLCACIWCGYGVCGYVCDVWLWNVAVCITVCGVCLCVCLFVPSHRGGLEPSGALCALQRGLSGCW